MGDDITIGVTEIVNNIEVTAQPNDQIVELSVVDNADDVTLNITPTVIEINVNKGSSYAKWGTILGTLSDQEDLQDALDLKADLVDGKVPSSQLPSYVDDIIEVADYASLPTTGEIGKIYVTLDNNKIYRWSGSIYIEIAANNAIWGAITGTLSNQLDLQATLDTKALKTIIITPNAPLSGGGDLSSNRTLSITQANTTTDGYLSSTDWNTFNSKLSSLSGAVLTTTNQNVAGVKKFTDGLTSDKAYNQKIISGTFMPDAGYGNFFQNDRQITFVQFNSAATAVTQFSFIYPASNTNQFYYLPDASGTLALISDAINNGVTTIAPSQNAVFDALALKQNLLTNPITGSTLLSGNTGDGYVPRASGSTTLTNSNIYDNGTNVGIGTTSPSQKLVVNGRIRVTTNDSDGGDMAVDDGGLSFSTNNSTAPITFKRNNYSAEAMRITSGGNVGIGTTSPSAKLDVIGNIYIRSNNILGLFNSDNTNNFQIYNSGSTGSGEANLIFTQGTVGERMRIATSGNVGIGTTYNGRKLNIGGSAYVDMVLKSTSASGVAGGGTLYFGNSADEIAYVNYDHASNFMSFATNNAERMRITSGGNVGIGTTSPSYQLQLSTDSAAKPTSALWTIASDKRIKENINSYTKGLNELLKINPITYDYNGLGGFKKGKGGVGIIAQEIAEILPDSVSSIKGKLNETDEEEIDILNFNGHELTYILINAVKELKAEIEILKNK